MRHQPAPFDLRAGRVSTAAVSQYQRRDIDAYAYIHGESICLARGQDWPNGNFNASPDENPDSHRHLYSDSDENPVPHLDLYSDSHQYNTASTDSDHTAANRTSYRDATANGAANSDTASN